MNPFWWLLALSILSFGEFSNGASRPAVVNIGAISMEAAVNDVNSDPSFLGGSKLNITVHDSNFNGFLSIIGDWEDDDLSLHATEKVGVMPKV
ncbi:hypothetical protein IFM89_004663 [Coptis chinensis]|uniref:Uncharacterized protein n=1 Tax=Coptis chinensis TaxID=261450 RepID=A0A835I7F4_9MAGN|nr:hypothetical protein IFM89_004663 [Coptis chinensis]